MGKFAGILLLFLFIIEARASMPIPIADDELAQWPVVVVGYWPKAPIKPHVLQKGDTLEKYEYHTQLVITKVLHGNVTPGTRHMFFDYGIGWNKDGTFVN